MQKSVGVVWEVVGSEGWGLNHIARNRKNGKWGPCLFEGGGGVSFKQVVFRKLVCHEWTIIQEQDGDNIDQS